LSFVCIIDLYARPAPESQALYASLIENGCELGTLPLHFQATTVEEF
jgi:hypothetical protein